MEFASVILLAGVLVFAAHFFAWIFSFTKIPDVLLLLMVGLLVGPLFGLIEPSFFGEAGTVFSFVVLAILLFEGGTSLRLDIMKQSWRSSILLVLVNFVVTVGVIGSLVWLFTDLPALLSFMMAAIIGGTTSAVIVPVLKQLKLAQDSEAVLILESAFSDVLSVVVTIALLAAYELGRFNVSAVAFDVVISFLGAAAIGFGAGIVWSILLSRVRQIQNSLFTTAALVFVLFGIAEYVGLSGPITALAFGITMGNVVFFKLYLEQKHVFLHTLLHPVALSDREREFFSEVVFLLQTFFFVFVGLSITFANFAVVLLGLALVLAMFLLRIPIVRLTAGQQRSAADRSIMAVLVPKGLAAAVLATLVAQRGVPGGVLIQDLTYTVILISVLLTSLLIFLVYKTPLKRLYMNVVGGTMQTASLEQEQPDQLA